MTTATVSAPDLTRLTAALPCERCDRLTRRRWGRAVICPGCLYTEIPHVKRGRPGAARPDHGPDQFDLCCARCEATWVGPEWEACWWCERALENQIAAQRTIVMSEPDDDLATNEAELQRVAKAWTARLAVAVTAGFVTKKEAESVLAVWVQKVERWWR